MVALVQSKEANLVEANTTRKTQSRVRWFLLPSRVRWFLLPSRALSTSISSKLDNAGTALLEAFVTLDLWL
jgi:hypothetical protein